MVYPKYKLRYHPATTWSQGNNVTCKRGLESEQKYITLVTPNRKHFLIPLIYNTGIKSCLLRFKIAHEGQKWSQNRENGPISFFPSLCFGTLGLEDSL